MNNSLIPIFGASVTALLGILAIFLPTIIEKFISVKAEGKLGMSEIKATYGGFFLGIASFALITQESNAFFALGFGWISAATIRLITLCFGYYSLRNMAAVMFELIIGLMCLANFIPYILPRRY